MVLKNNTNTKENVIVSGVLAILDNNNIWWGTMTDLRTTLTKVANKKDLPRSPSCMRKVLNRVINRLRSRGVSVKFGRTPDHMRTRYVKFVK